MLALFNNEGVPPPKKIVSINRSVSYLSAYKSITSSLELANKSGVYNLEKASSIFNSLSIIKQIVEYYIKEQEKNINKSKEQERQESIIENNKLETIQE